MNKILLAAFSIGFIFLAGCEKKAPETKSAQDTTAITDSIKKEKLVEAPVSKLTGKALLVAKQWNATEFETSNIKLSGELIDLKYNFKSDSTFDFASDGKNESGTWEVNEAGTKLKLKYITQRVANYDIKELNELSMIIAGKEHNMFRTITLAKK